MADKSKGFGVPTNSTPKKRKERFNDNENHILVDEIMANADRLFGKNARNSLGKITIWEQVARKVSKERGMNRTVEDCKKRFHDYKRKVFQVLERASQSSDVVSMEEILHNRQLKVAKFFQMKFEKQNEISLPYDDLSFDGESSTLSTRQLSQTIDLSGNSEDEFIPVTQNRSKSSFFFNSGDDAQDRSISQSNERNQSAQSDSKGQKPTELKTPDEDTLTVPNPQIDNLDGKLEQLITFQRNNNEILQNIQTNLSTTLQLQKKMNRLLKSNFNEMQKSMSQTQKMLKDHENIMELKVKGIQDALHDLKYILRDKMQDSITSDDSEDGLRLGQSASKGSANSPQKNSSPEKKRKRKLNFT